MKAWSSFRSCLAAQEWLRSGSHAAELRQSLAESCAESASCPCLHFEHDVHKMQGSGFACLRWVVLACLLRFRPIVMTTLAARLSGLPLALGHGTGSEMRRPLGIAIVGGLLLSQMLTLFTTPVVYLTLDRFSRRQRGPREDGRAAEPR